MVINKIFKQPYFNVGLGLFILFTFIGFLQIYIPFFFTCDDNFHQFLPVIIEAYQALNDGIFPTISPAIYMGYPTTSLGTYSILSPVLYICYIIASIFFEAFYTIEIYAIVNLSAGFLMMYKFLSKLEVDRSNAMFGALSFVISCPVIGMSKNWYYMLPTAFFIPLIFYMTLCFFRERTYKNLLYMALASGAFFYMGNAQMWIYTLILSGLFFFFSSNSVMEFIKAIPKLSLNYILIALIIFPLFLAQIMTIENIERYGSSWAALIDAGGIRALMLPNYSIYCYNGAIFILVALISYFYKEARVFFLLLLLTFTLSLGRYGIIYEAFHSLPFFNKFTHAYKFLIFVSFFSIVAACIVLKRYKYGFLLGALNLTLLIYNHYNVSMNNNFFYTYPTEKPYPALSDETAILENSRFITASLERPRGTGKEGGCSNINHVNSLNNNYPAYYRLEAFRGYNDYLMAGSEEVRMALRRLVDTPVAALEKFGINYVVKCNDLADLYQTDSRASLIDFTRIMPVIQPYLKSVYKNKYVEIFRFPNADPKAFFYYNDIKVMLKHKFNQQGAVIYLNEISRGKQIIVNLLHRALYKAYDDKGNRLLLNKDEWGRMLVMPNDKSEVIYIKYSPFSFENYLLALQAIKRKLLE